MWLELLEIFRSGDLLPETDPSTRHFCHMFRSDELRDVLTRCGFDVTAMSASNALTTNQGELLADVRDTELWQMILDFEVETCASPGMLDAGGVIRDLSGVIDDVDPSTLGDESLAALRALDASALPAVDGSPRMGPCVGNVGKLVCIGLNYEDHARETNSPIPAEPIIFMKATSAIVGPDDGITIPKRSEKTDWEVELGVIIGKDARYLSSPDEAPDYIAGYCISHDVSERAFQLDRGGQWTRGKSSDNFNPLGPWLVTEDEIEDVNNLALELSVNGQQMQKGNTGKMIFNAYYLVHYLSQFMTLEAGDLITTGTPPGVGMGKNPPQFLNAGDVVALSVEGLGEQRQVCVDA